MSTQRSQEKLNFIRLAVIHRRNVPFVPKEQRENHETISSSFSFSSNTFPKWPDISLDHPIPSLSITSERSINFFDVVRASMKAKSNTSVGNVRENEALLYTLSDQQIRKVSDHSIPGSFHAHHY